MNYRIILLFILSGSVFKVAFSQDINKATSTKQNLRYNGQPLPELTRGPYLQVATTNSIVVRWRTSTLARSRVRYGLTPGKLTLSAIDSGLVTDHSVTLSKLLPQTKYYYSVGGIRDTLQGDENNYFVTLPVAGKDGLYRIGVFGDCGDNSVNQQAVRDQLINYLGNNHMNAWILLGDNAYQDGNDAEYQLNFFDVYKNNLLKKYPLYPSPGNHEYIDGEFSERYAQRSKEVAYFHAFSMPENGEAGGMPSKNKAYYSFDIGNAHFLSLDSYGVEENAYRLFDTLGPQASWIKKDLEANKNKGWIIAYLHHPPYSNGKEEVMVKIRQNVIPILERYGVDLVLCGHNHLYERSGLLDGNYGNEPTFNSTKYGTKQPTALYDGTANSCPYIKTSGDKGTVYVISGSAGQLGKTSNPHRNKNMIYANNEIGGAAMLEIQSNRLDLKWICADGDIRDQFTMMKDVNKKTTIRLKKGEKITLTASFIGKYNWSIKGKDTKSIEISPSVGETNYWVRDEFGCVQDSFDVIVSK